VSSKISQAGSGLAALTAGAAVLGLSPILVRLADVGPVAIGFWRLTLALPILLIWHLIARRRQPAQMEPKPKSAPWVLFLSGLLFSGDLGFWHVSLQHTSVANSIFLLSAATPLFATIGGRIFLGQTIGRWFVAGMLVCIVGVALLVSGRAGLGQGEWLGDALSVLAGVFFASYLVALAKCRQVYSVSAISLYSTLSTTIVLLPLSIILGETVIPQSAGGWIDLAALGLLCQAAGQTLLAFGLAFVTAGLSSLIMLLEPVISLIVAWPVLGEVPQAMQLLGSVAILFGIWLARRGSAPEPALP
jgi:drug/metabolite transporter (DMT)-like permease